jgi:tetratricopeptide (TPR) repeat protein
LVAAAIAAVIVINLTNLRVVQADMIYKRGKPFDVQAMGQNDPQNWDVAISIYEKALELAPWEDFYYLFLGRAYLERSVAASDEAELTSLYNTAEDLLIQAQTLNPLNTDHTANLARLYTRWYATDPENDQSEALLQKSEAYYQDALELSPQNSIIRNEYARLALELKKNCDQALAIYEDSIDIDPFYSDSYIAMSDALLACAAAQTDEAVSAQLYTLANEILSEGLALDRRNVRGWLRLGQIRQQIGDNEGALRAFTEARFVDRAGAIPSWNVDYAEASVYRDMGNTTMARALAEQALLSAPPDAAAQIEAFLAGLPEE